MSYSPNQDQEPIASIEEMVDWIRAGEKPASQWRIGTEHEKIGMHLDGYKPVAYEGERGIAVLLQQVVERSGAEAIYEEGRIIGAQQGLASLTLEPGGQVELSGAPLRTIHETCAEFRAHLELMKEISEPLGIVWLGLGMNPLHNLEEIPRMPKSRYDLMRAYLPTRGSLALEMMHLTATVQANFDFSDEADMVEKFRLALALSPIISSVYANSSLSQGKPNGFISRRIHIWRDTDPDRTGMLPFVFEEGFGYRNYVEWALDVPMFFIVREGRYRAMHHMTFRQFWERGYQRETATMDDFSLHLTTLFPEARLKRFIEVRGTDAVPPALTCSLPAFWKGVLYDQVARREATDLVRNFDVAELERMQLEIARYGLAAGCDRWQMSELAALLLEIADRGLGRIARDFSLERDERAFLDPIREQIEKKMSPGEEVRTYWEGRWQESPQRLIDYARY